MCWEVAESAFEGNDKDTKRDILQFEVSLADVAPRVWRRIEVPASYCFWDLHVAVQDAMGWLDYHPEDCGGPDGYAELLKVLKNRRHKEHASMVEWLGRPFDASVFDATSVRFDNPRTRWRRAFGSA